MACIQGAVPWWSLPLNWIIGASHLASYRRPGNLIPCEVTFGNLCGSLFFAAVLTKCTKLAASLYLWTCANANGIVDTGIISTAPYNAYAVSFAL